LLVTRSRTPVAGVVMLASLALLCAVSGCSSEPDVPSLPAEPGGTGTTAATSAPTTGRSVPATTIRFSPRGRPSAADRRVLAGYRRFLDAIATAYTKGDVRPLAAATVHPARAFYTKRARAMQARGQTQQGPIVSSPAVLSIRGNQGVLLDCLDLRRFNVYDADGRRVQPAETVLTASRATLVAVEGQWLLSDYHEQAGTCR
jgi:hypothetical protein